METCFYVYEHWRPDTNVCFYVGKGKGNRAYDLKGRHKHYLVVMRKLSRLKLMPEIRIIKSGLTEDEAFALEIKRIKFWKRKNINLVNQANGGQGSSGWKHTEEWKQANSERLLGKPLSLKAKRNMSKGAFRRAQENPLTEEAKAKTAASVKALWADPEYRNKIIEAHKRRPPISEETRAKMRASQAKRGSSRPEAHREAMRQAAIAWHARKRAAGLESGQQSKYVTKTSMLSDKHRTNLSIALKAYHARRRNQTHPPVLGA